MPLPVTQDLHLDAIRAWLPPRAPDSHKGDFGSVGVIGGSTGMTGAALLAARAALWLGAGRVYAGLLDDRIALDPVVPELMLPSPDAVLRLTPPGCLVVGPGLGTNDAAHAWLHAALASPLPLLIDADGLNLLAMDPELQTQACRRPAPTLLTPHPGEAGRLLGTDGASVQADRQGAVLALVKRYRCFTVLKGAESLIHAPDAPLWRNPTANPALAAPGMGDVLAGIIAAFVAQGLAPEKAAALGACLHGTAADRLVAQGIGPVGLTASEVAQAARSLLNSRFNSQA